MATHTHTHELTSTSGGQLRPSYAGLVRIWRWRSRTPPSHAAEQLLKALHGPTAQSTGHGATLQKRHWYGLGHAVPAYTDGEGKCVSGEGGGEKRGTRY